MTLVSYVYPAFIRRESGLERSSRRDIPWLGGAMYFASLDHRPLKGLSLYLRV